jgi:hypothetical protein
MAGASANANTNSRTAAFFGFKTVRTSTGPALPGNAVSGDRGRTL